MKKKKTLWIIATLIFITNIVFVINNYEGNIAKIKEKSAKGNTEVSAESTWKVNHTPEEVLEANELIAKGEDYHLIYTGDSVIAYSFGKVVDEVKIGSSTYAGPSRNCNHYFLVENTVKKVNYTNGHFEETNILDGVKRIVSTRAVYNQDARKELLVETLDGKFKMYIYDNEWVDRTRD